MSTKLKDLDISVRLLHVTKSMGIETITELKEWYKTCSLNNLPNHMGRKSLTEIEELISANQNGLGLYEQLELLKEERKVNKLKTLVKKLHNEMFYKDEYDRDKLLNISSQLVKHLK